MSRLTRSLQPAELLGALVVDAIQQGLAEMRPWWSLC